MEDTRRKKRKATEEPASSPEAKSPALEAYTPLDIPTKEIKKPAVPTVIHWKKFRVENIVIGKAKSAAGRASMLAYYKVPETGHNIPIRIQGPCMRAPFGISDNSNLNSAANGLKYSLDYSLNDEDGRAFRELLLDIETFYKRHVVAEIPQLFPNMPNTMTMEDMDNLWISCVKKPDDPKYPDRLKTKVFMQKDMILATFFSTEKDEVTGLPLSVPSSQVKKGSLVTPVIENGGIYIAPKNKNAPAGTSWKTVQGRLEPDTSLSSYAMVDDDQD
jgi:hypothetical protein